MNTEGVNTEAAILVDDYLSFQPAFSGAAVTGAGAEWRMDDFGDNLALLY